VEIGDEFCFKTEVMEHGLHNGICMI